jgi:hypothetical protein
MGLSRPAMSGTASDRAERAKQALRENLKRRKAQARGQARPDAGPQEQPGDTKPPHQGSD